MNVSGRLTVADIGISVSCEDNIFQQTHPETHNPDNPFALTRDSRPADVSIHVNSSPIPSCSGNRIICSEDHLWQMFVHKDGFLDCRFYEENPHQPAWWFCIDHNFRKITIGVNLQLIPTTKNKHPQIDISQLAADRKLLIPILINHNALVVHGAGGSLNSKGLLFSGPSGIGKSTIATLLSEAGHTMFSDECMAIRKQVDNNWQAYGTPWSSSAGILHNDSTPLKAIFFLKQAKSTRLRHLSQREKVSKIIQFCCIPWYLTAFADTALNLCEELIADIPLYELCCSLDDDPVKTIEQFAESL